MTVMIKSMDMPEKCINCRILGCDEGYNDGENECYYCPITREWMTKKAVLSGRREDCPLEEES